MTIQEVAKKAGVSAATVSYAINHKNRVNEETRVRIMKIVEETGYVPNSLAQNLLKRTTGLIGLVAPDISNLYNATLISHLQRHARHAGFSMLLGDSAEDPQMEKELVDGFISRRTDAIVFIPGNRFTRDSCAKIAVQCGRRKLPLVFVNLMIPDLKSNHVVPDLEEGEYQVTMHLLEQGLENLVFIGGEPEAPFSSIRYEGFLRAMKEKNIPLRKDPYLCCGSTYSFFDGFNAISTFQAESRKMPDGFVAINDMVAYGAIRKIKELGLSVPQDVSVVGFDDLTLPTLDGFGLTTMRIPIEEMAIRCMEIIKEQTFGRQEMQQHVLKLELICRDSVKQRNRGIS